MTNNDFGSIYRQMLTQFAESDRLPPDGEVTFFPALKGNAYTGELMWVGRAVNGWGDGWKPRDLREPGNLNEIMQNLMQDGSSTDGCPLQWIRDKWGDTVGDYNPARSAFWRCAKKVVTGLSTANVTRDDWPSALVWSNLYKIAPHKGGNPSSTQAAAQLAGCRQLLEAEIATFAPKRLVLATGANWAENFLDLPCFDIRTVARDNGYVERRGNLVVDGREIGTFVVASHPQGENETNWVREVMTNLA